MKQRALSITLVLSLVLLVAGFSCQHKAMQTSLGVAASLRAMQEAEIGLHASLKVTDDEHRVLQQGFIVLAKSDKDVRQCIYASGASACVDIGINAVHNLLDSPAVVGIKNPDSKQQIEVLGQSLLLSLNVLKGAL